MITITTEVDVKGITGKAVTDFMLNCGDENYRNWWPGTHLAFHTLKRFPGDTGNVVYMDEYVGNYRIRMKAVVVKAVPGKKLLWQLKKFFRLPVRLLLRAEDTGYGVRITHTIYAGFSGPGRVFDPVFGIFFNGNFRRAMDEHARTEFQKLSAVLR